jgi:hypothetical protein
VLLAAVGFAAVGRGYLNGHTRLPHTTATMKENLAWMRARTP